MTHMAIAIDLDACVGCHSCTAACKQENNVRLGSSWSKVHTIGPTGLFPDLELYFLPVLCQHCKDPECVRVCPTGASHKMANGIVLVDRDKCIGCQYCVMACPYGVRSFNEEEKVVEKCTLCAHLVEKGEQPFCVSQCPAQARVYGDLDDPYSKISLKIQQAGKNAHALPDVGNHPSVRYILSRFTWRG